MEARAYQTLLVEVSGTAARVTLNRPERRNAIGAAMANELCWALGDAFDAPEIRSVVLTGAGKTFCAGGDFSQMTGAGGEELPHKGGFEELLKLLWRAPKPVIARVQGPALGGGLGLVAGCTFAVAAKDAKLGTPEIDVGLFPFMILALLSRLVPRRRLLEMIVSGEKITADEGVTLGLLNRAVPAEELDAEVQRLVDLVASKSGSTLRLGLTAFAATEELTLDEKLPKLAAELASCLSTDDAREGLMAFLEKRPPRWTGR